MPLAGVLIFNIVHGVFLWGWTYFSFFLPFLRFAGFALRCVAWYFFFDGFVDS
jgi:hypothetical protein